MKLIASVLVLLVVFVNGRTSETSPQHWGTDKLYDKLANLGTEGSNIVYVYHDISPLLEQLLASEEEVGAFELLALPYAKDALEPHISRETLEWSRKIQNTHVNKLNELVAGTILQEKTLEEIVKSTSGQVFNHAASIWDMTFEWNSMSPNGGGVATGALARAIDESFKSFDAFKVKFTDSAVNLFGSGYVWLVKKADGTLDIVKTQNARTPITEEGVTPLLVCDVWEHAYFIDYRNNRADYLVHFFEVVNWDFANQQFAYRRN